MTLVATFVYIFTVSYVSSSIFTIEEKTRIESFVEAVKHCRNIPGLTLAVVKEDETWTKAFGTADRERGVNVTTDTLFGIGSVTKAFTTTLIAMFLNESDGRWTWTSKVSDILGSDFAFIDEERTRELTLRDLLTHRTGLITADLVLYAGYDHTFSRAEFAKRFRFLPEENPSRDVWEYNNWVYGLAGYVVEVLSGEPYEVTLDKRILQPLGMAKTKLLGKGLTTDEEGVAKPYFLIEDQLVLTQSSIYDIHPDESAGAIASSAVDMAKWMNFLLREGKTTTNDSLVSWKLLKKAFELHESLPNSWLNQLSIFRPTFPEADVIFGYGYAWFISTYKGYRKYWHSGGLHSYITYLQIFPDLNISIFTSVNGPGTVSAVHGQQAIGYFITDTFLGEDPWLNATTGCSFPMPWKEDPSSNQNNSDVTNQPVECPQCYVGRYGHQLYGDLEVEVDSESGSLKLHYGRIKGALNSTHNVTRFKLDVGEPFKLYSRPGNETVLVEVTFHEMEKEKYQSVDYPQHMSFSRKVSFGDEIKTSGQGTMYMSAVSFIKIIFSIVIVFTS